MSAQKILPPEQAFRDSDEYRFQGKKLEPFSFVRQTAAIKLGAVFWSLGPDDFHTIRNAEKDRLKDGTKLKKADRAALMEQPDEITIYGEVYRDAAIVLWLCHQPDSTCLRARRQPSMFESQIDKWADDKGIYLKGPNMAEGIKVFLGMIRDLGESTAVPVPGDGKTDEGEDDPNE